MALISPLKKMCKCGIMIRFRVRRGQWTKCGCKKNSIGESLSRIPRRLKIKISDFQNVFDKRLIF